MSVDLRNKLICRVCSNLTAFKDAFGGQRRDHPVDELLQQQTMEHLKITVPALNRDLETLYKRNEVVNII